VSSVFERDTAAEPLGDGRYRVRFDPRWWIVRGPNGGVVAASIVRAMEAEVGDPARGLRSLTVHYPSAPREGEAEVAVRIERAGRGLTTLSARLEQQGRLIALALAAFAGAYPPAVTYDRAPLPEPGEAPPLPERPEIPFSQNYVMRAALGAEGEPEVGGWLELTDPSPLDAAYVVALTDAWWPAPFNVTGRPIAAPTIDLTVHVRAPLPLPAGPVLGEFTSALARDGYSEEDGRLWAADGTLLAQSRQLALAL
jgi:acyl-CoA thioesterase